MTAQTLERLLQPLTAPLQGTLLRWLYLNLPPCAITTKRSHQAYSAAAGVLMEVLESGELSGRDSSDVRRYLGVVAPLIEDYEAKMLPPKEVKPEAMLRFFMDQHKLTQYDLAAELGGQPVVSNILRGKRLLTRGQIERLSARFHVSPAVFYSSASGRPQLEC